MMSNIPKMLAIVPKPKMKAGGVKIIKLGSALHQIIVICEQFTIVRPICEHTSFLKEWEGTEELKSTEKHRVYPLS